MHSGLYLQYPHTAVIAQTHLLNLDLRDTNALHTVQYVYHPTPMTKMMYHRANINFVS